MTGILAATWKVATIAIPVPLALLAAAWAWLAIDKSSSVRRAVDKAVTEYAAGAQIKALEATLDAERRLRMFAEGKAAAAEAANKDFQVSLTLAEIEKENLSNDLASLQAVPVDPQCVVTPGLLELRER